MKVIALLLSILAFFSLTYGQKKKEDDGKIIRYEKCLNPDWTFNYFESESAGSGYESPGFNDSRWPAVSLPHTWNSYETTGESTPFTRSPGEIDETFWWTGWGWYRKHFSIDGSMSDKRVFIQFDGVQKYCKIWINGKYVGDHLGGYGSFDFDITGFIRPGEDNLLAVAVSYRQKDEFSIHPITPGSHNVSCGIVRNVTISLKNNLYIPMQGSSTHDGGTYITTPEVSGKEAIVRIRTWVKNESPETRTCILQSSIRDLTGLGIQVTKSEADIKPGEIYMFDQVVKSVKNPHLWSTDDPYLYSVFSEVFDRKVLMDTCSSFFGFRSIKTDGKTGDLYLNNRKTELTGLRRHDEYPWLGDAVPDWIIRADYFQLSEKPGINFVNTLYYPGNEESYRMTDKYGLLVQEDFTAITEHGFTPEEQKSQIAEMIRRDRNHPSIITWFVGDEQGNDYNRIFALSEDSTRPQIRLRASLDSALSYSGYPGNLQGKSSRTASKGRPAKVILESSAGSIPADKGSLIRITADIADSEGMHADSATNTLKWIVRGSAELSGPSFFVSYADSGRRARQGRYTTGPAVNLVRSTGKPGKIVVTVFSAGLASDSCEIVAAGKENDNRIISEPTLRYDGRKPVVKTLLVTERTEEIPEEIKPVREDINLKGKDKREFEILIRNYIRKNNPGVDTLSAELSALTDVLTGQLVNNGGKMTASDFNFNSGHYNTCRLIAGYIASTKLPPLYKEGLRQYYSETIIGRGLEKNPGDEMNWMNWIPSGGTVVMVRDEKPDVMQKNVIYTQHTDLPDIIKAVYPQFSKFSPEAKERALVFINKMNPAIHVKYQYTGTRDDDSDRIVSATYTVEKGQPILIPEYKFISE